MLRLKLIVDRKDWHVSTLIVQTIVRGMAIFLPPGQLAEIFAIPAFTTWPSARTFARQGASGWLKGFDRGRNHGGAEEWDGMTAVETSQQIVILCALSKVKVGDPWGVLAASTSQCHPTLYG